MPSRAAAGGGWLVARQSATGVLGCQIAFVGAGYASAVGGGDRRREQADIWGMVDDFGCSLLCGVLGLARGAFGLRLEQTRPCCARRSLRVALSLAMTSGILLTCAVRESWWYAPHALGAAIAFGSGSLLVMVVVMEQPRATRCWRHALFLAVVTTFAGIMQALNLLSVRELSPVALAIAEILMVVSFGVTISGTLAPPDSKTPEPTRAAGSTKSFGEESPDCVMASDGVHIMARPSPAKLWCRADRAQ